MKRYLIFAGDSYDTLGGVEDLLMDADDLGQTEFRDENGKMYGWVNALDTETLKKYYLNQRGNIEWKEFVK